LELGALLFQAAVEEEQYRFTTCGHVTTAATRQEAGWSHTKFFVISSGATFLQEVVAEELIDGVANVISESVRSRQQDRVDSGRFPLQELVVGD
jgi:hypothetical protein